MDNEEIQQLLKTGIEAAQSGNRIIARHILEQVVSKDPINEMGWLWLASVVDTVEERRESLQKVLSINPNNERARQALSKLPRPELPEVRGTESTTPAGRLGRAPTAAPSRLTPPPAQIDRPIFVPKPPRRRRRVAAPMIALLAFLAVGMIGLGLALFWTERDDEEKQTPTPTEVAAAVIATPTRTVLVTPGPSPTPHPLETLGPTWTPSNTPTPTETPLPTATPLPLTTYTLLTAGQRGGQEAWALYTLRADGSDEQALTLTPGSEISDVTLLKIYDPAYSPDGSQIVFSARLSEAGGDEYEDLFITASDGGEIQRITNLFASHVEGASWSPDGTQLVFASDSDGDYDLYVMPADGGSPSPLTNNEAEDRYPAWSPDGAWIAYASDATGPGTLEVWRMDPEGQQVKQLTDNQNSSLAPAWSPDSQSIVFVSNRRAHYDLYIMTANGDGDRALLVRDVEADEYGPAWSPDGTWIAFSSNRESAVFDLFLIRPDGSDKQRITTRDGDSRDVVWKP